MTPESFAELGRQIGEITKEHVARAVSAISARLSAFEERLATIKDGVDGIAGEQGIQGAQGPQGELGPQGPQGIPGRDGLPGVPGQTGEKGIDGKHGKDGVDGLPFDALEQEYDERGRMYLVFRGATEKRFFVHGAFQGLFTEGNTYKRSDSVIWAGSQWEALLDNDGSVKPDQVVKDGPRVWQLSVMRGKPGERGRAGLDGKDGVNGKDGRNGVDWGRG